MTKTPSQGPLVRRTFLYGLGFCLLATVAVPVGIRVVQERTDAAHPLPSEVIVDRVKTLHDYFGTPQVKMLSDIEVATEAARFPKDRKALLQGHIYRIDFYETNFSGRQILYNADRNEIVSDTEFIH